MSKRDELKNLQEAIAILEKESDKLRDQSSEMSESCSGIISELILEEKMLENSTWTIEINQASGGIYLEHTVGIGDPNLKPLADLTRTNYHCCFELEPGIELRYDDNLVLLCFTDVKMITSFIRKRGLIIDGNSVSHRLHKLRREVKTLETISHFLNLKG